MEVLISPIPAVLVANGYEDVRQAAIAGPMKAGNCGKLYCGVLPAVVRELRRFVRDDLFLGGHRLDKLSLFLDRNL